MTDTAAAPLKRRASADGSGSDGEHNDGSAVSSESVRPEATPKRSKVDDVAAAGSAAVTAPATEPAQPATPAKTWVFGGGATGFASVAGTSSWLGKSALSQSPFAAGSLSSPSSSSWLGGSTSFGAATTAAAAGAASTPSKVFGNASEPAGTPSSFGALAQTTTSTWKDSPTAAAPAVEQAASAQTAFGQAQHRAETPEPASVVTGEEDDRTEVQLRAKLFQLDDGKNEWRERGVGVVRLNVSKNDPTKVRIVMRADGSLRLILNSLVFEGMPVSRIMDRYVRLPCATEGGELHTYLIRTRTAEDTHKLLEAMKRAARVKEVEPPAVSHAPASTPARPTERDGDKSAQRSGSDSERRQAGAEAASNSGSDSDSEDAEDGQGDVEDEEADDAKEADVEDKADDSATKASEPGDN